MILLMSPAKQIDVKRSGDIPFVTSPVFQNEAVDIMLQLTTFDVEDIAEIFSISLQLATAVKRWAYDFVSTDAISQVAILAYWGVAYKSLKAHDFSSDDFEYAQQHLRIGSGNYGILRPLDMIKPYRMEYYTHIDGYGSNMQSYWRQKITDELLNAIRSDDQRILINLSSKETFTSFDIKRISAEAKVVTILFLNIGSKGMKSVPAVLAKQARGALIRFILKNRITEIKDIYSFDECGMTWYEDGTTDEIITFIYEGN